MALPQGINFRGTSGYVTDGTNEDYEISASLNYPRTSAQGNTVGWESGTSGGLPSPANRNSGIDRRVAGTVDATATARILRYRIDLPSSGNYSIRCACGDYIYTAVVHLDVEDTTTSLGPIATTDASGGNQFRDAVDASYSAANWPGSNTAVTKTFSTTICRFALGDGSATFPKINHVYIEAVDGGTTRGTPFGTRGTAFNGGRTFWGIIRRVIQTLRPHYA